VLDQWNSFDKPTITMYFQLTESRHPSHLYSITFLSRTNVTKLKYVILTVMQVNMISLNSEY
jgi:hypothetical protein